MSESAQVSSLPLPPMQYIKLYTDENIRKDRAPNPPQPPNDSYFMFGVPFNSDDVIIRSLESQGIRRLYPQNFDHRKELKKMNYSILINFLDLLDILIKAPDSHKREEKMEDISLLFINIHHLINEYRPHQARETLRLMLDSQKKLRIEIKERFSECLDQVQEILQQALSNLPEDYYNTDNKLNIPADNFNHEKIKTKERCQDACYILDRLMCNITDSLQMS